MAKKTLPLSKLESCGNSNSLHRIWAKQKSLITFWVKLETFE